MAFELIRGYSHWFGKKTHLEGLVGTGAEAWRWNAACRQAADKPPVPPEDPLRTCPVAAGSGHPQRPWCDHRPKAAAQGEEA